MQKQAQAASTEAVEPSVAERIAAALKRHGVKYLFGQSNPPRIFPRRTVIATDSRNLISLRCFKA
jgi:hypothetical protein